YHNYAAMGRLSQMIPYLGLLAARPLAGILDIALWSKFWGNMWVALLLLSMIFAATAIIFYRLFEKIFGTGKLFLLFFALLPLGMEGSYWISASSRLLPGLLFCALSASAFYSFLQSRKARFCLLSVGLQFLTFCFYEQVAVLSCGLNILIGILMRKEAKRRWPAALSCIGVAAVYFLSCKMSGESALYGTRTALMLPTSAYYFRNFLPELFSQFYEVFVRGGALLLKNGLWRGFSLIAHTNGFWKLAIYLVFCILSFFILVRENGKCEKKRSLQIFCGILLAVLPTAPFFILANPYFSLRGALPSLVGIALVLDGAVVAILKKEKFVSLFAVVCAVVFSAVTVSELADYRANYEADQAVVTLIAETETQGETVAILGLKESFLPSRNFEYHEHIKGVTSSSWALTGAVRCVKEDVFEKRTYIPYDLTAEFLYKPWNYAEKQIGAVDAVFAYDEDENVLLPLSVAPAGDGVYDLYDESGEFFGQIVEEDQTARFFRK
ncbi:MAG: hypothetical protein IJU41_09545, partial [Clostridia bacterium]|nr:hypothetical protein [Clostridia bacterium]